jgi:hypothetical protein
MHTQEKYRLLQKKTEQRTQLLKELQTVEEQKDFKYILKKLPTEKFGPRLAVLVDYQKNTVHMVDKITRINSHINLTGKNNLTICQL